MFRLTRVGHELEGPAEFPVASCSSGSHVEDVGGKGGKTFYFCVSGRCFNDAVTSFILVLRSIEMVRV